jgi:hypothetical protein
MTDLETKLALALKLLSQSAEWYIEDGSWIDNLTEDLESAKKVISEFRKAKREENHA